MDTLKVRQRLLSGDLNLRKNEGKSDVWTKFGIVIDSDAKDLEFAGCKLCNHVVTYKGRSSGTTTMKKHQCKTQGQTVLTSAVKHLPAKPFSSHAQPSTSAKKAITDACVNFISQDLRPFDTVGGKGFLKLIQEVSFYDQMKN